MVFFICDIISNCLKPIFRHACFTKIKKIRRIGLIAHFGILFYIVRLLNRIHSYLFFRGGLGQASVSITEPDDRHDYSGFGWRSNANCGNKCPLRQGQQIMPELLLFDTLISTSGKLLKGNLYEFSYIDYVRLD